MTKLFEELVKIVAYWRKVFYFTADANASYYFLFQYTLVSINKGICDLDKQRKE